MRCRPGRGLTLLELMVALAIVAVLMTLALPSFGSIMARQRLKAAAEQMSIDLAELRQQAAQRDRTLHVNLSAGAQWCYSLAVASGCDCRVPQGCQLKTVHAKDHPGVTLLEGQDLRIDPQAGANTGSALLQGSDGARLRVGLSPLGRPKVCAPEAAVSGFTAC
jgi:type IV fimbrial biogenesis protein FimT